MKKLWELFIKYKGEYFEESCSASYRYILRKYRKRQAPNKYLTYTIVDDDMGIEEFRNRTRATKETIIFKSEEE